jgi:hypothetical protein
LDATAELHEVLLEPLMLLYKFAGVINDPVSSARFPEANLFQVANVVSIDSIIRFKILDMIPPGGQVSFEELAEKTKLDKRLIRRLLRYAISMRILTEPEPDVVAHTKTSKFLAVPYVSSWVTFESHDTWPAIPGANALFQ